jgi:Zn-dependent protease with chaperone function
MDSSNLSYSPVAAVNKDILTPSKEFRHQVLNVINSIASFAIVYFLLFISAIIIACVMGFIGYMLIVGVHIFIISIMGIGFMLSGLMLVFFLIKFLFTKTTFITNRHEITETDQPELFDFIRKLTIETGAPFPKHIYLTPEVNAGVFFDSSFWSMFLPIKKNLNIGLALVNTLNQSEFKAVLAHEFGHFSQRSMRFGSYVYNVNKILYDMLYQNKSYDKILNTLARGHSVLRFAAIINVKIVKCIQQILKEMYVKLNKTHLGLSREMEFHADTMAAYYSGSNNMVSALRRIEIADNCYNVLLGFLNGELKEKRRSPNIYPEHLIVLKQFANANHLNTDENGLPLVDKAVAMLKNSRVIIRDQWASHPTADDREERLTDLNIPALTINEPAWLLFRDAIALQQQQTEHLYSSINNYHELEIIDIESFKKYFYTETTAYTCNSIYKGFYDSRLITNFNVDEAVLEADSALQTDFDHLLNDHNCNLPKAIAGMNTDIALLDSVMISKNDDINTFDFEGIKYEQQEAAEVQDHINNEIKEAKQQIERLDREIFIFFLQTAKTGQLKQSLTDQYKKVLHYQQSSQLDYDNYTNIMADINPIYKSMLVEDIYTTVERVYKNEKKVKERIREVMADEETIPLITILQKEMIDKYLSNNWIYYLEPSYDNDAIAVFNNGLNAYMAVITERNFQLKKSLTDFQLELLNN